MTRDFKIGDKVIYPNHGLAVVENINDRELGDRQVSFYHLRICSNNSIIMIPTEGSILAPVGRLLGYKAC